MCVSSFEPERLLGLLRRLVREPKAQDLGLGIAADLSERLVARVVRSHFHFQSAHEGRGKSGKERYDVE